MAWEAGSVLMGTIDRGIHRHLPIDQSSRVSLGQQGSKDLVPGTVNTETSVPFPDRLPRSEVLGKIAPGNPYPVAVDHSFGCSPVVVERPSAFARRVRHERRDQVPLRVG